MLISPTKYDIGCWVKLIEKASAIYRIDRLSVTLQPDGTQERRYDLSTLGWVEEKQIAYSVEIKRVEDPNGPQS